MKKPVIGITCNFSFDDKQPIFEGIGVAKQNWQLVADDYISAIERAGGIPVIIPFLKDINVLKNIIFFIDGLFLTGGNDIDPRNYNQLALQKTGALNPERDSQDLFLTKFIIENTNIPILGVCRGMQVLNVVMGGTIQQEIDPTKYMLHTLLMYPKDACSHKVQISPNSLLHDIIKSNTLGVNSFHHQAVDKLGQNIKTVAVTADGLVEALELDNANGRFLLAVQWHPEMMAEKYNVQQKIIDRFVDASRTNVKEKNRCICL